MHNIRAEPFQRFRQLTGRASACAADSTSKPLKPLTKLVLASTGQKPGENSFAQKADFESATRTIGNSPTLQCWDKECVES